MVPRARAAGDEPDEPAKVYKYVPTKSSFSSLEMFYQEVVDAQARGRSAGRVKD
jgi:hypothetical protein